MNKFNIKNDLPLMSTSEGIVLFHPHIPKNAKKYVNEVLDSRWIGQGPKVDLFEQKFKNKFLSHSDCLAVGSGTDALHLSYIMAGIKAGDEVLTPLFTCTATTLPLLYIGAKPIFVDINPRTLNISIEDIKKKISPKTKAIVCVHYGGLPCDMNEINKIALEFKIPVIEDAAHALGAKYHEQKIGTISDFTVFSFQAIKHITTGDGGMISFRNTNLRKLGSRLRWFGIDREDKQHGIWENDIKEIGYKYQMTDIAAALGLAGLEEFDQTSQLRKSLYARYVDNLKNFNDVIIVGDNDPYKEHGAWLFTILVEDKIKLQQKLRANGIESGQTHYRNDRYTIFNSKDDFPNMDQIDDNYLILPLHTKMSIKDIDLISSLIKSGW
jgi:perosamine synthetase